MFAGSVEEDGDDSNDLGDTSFVSAEPLYLYFKALLLNLAAHSGHTQDSARLRASPLVPVGGSRGDCARLWCSFHKASENAKKNRTHTEQKLGPTHRRHSQQNDVERRRDLSQTRCLPGADAFGVHTKLDVTMPKLKDPEEFELKVVVR